MNKTMLNIGTIFILVASVSAVTRTTCFQTTVSIEPAIVNVGDTFVVSASFANCDGGGSGQLQCKVNMRPVGSSENDSVRTLFFERRTLNGGQATNATIRITADFASPGQYIVESNIVSVQQRTYGQQLAYASVVLTIN